MRLKGKQYGKRRLANVGDMCRIASGVACYYPGIANQNLIIMSINSSYACARRQPLASRPQRPVRPRIIAVATVLRPDLRTMRINLTDLIPLSFQAQERE